MRFDLAVTITAALMVVFCLGHEGQAQENWDRAPFSADIPSSSHRFDELYYMQPHNSFEHSNKLTNWLDAGYRSLELDVIDKGKWESHAKGPSVTHSSTAWDVNCSAGDDDRLGDCLGDIVGWINANRPRVPIVVFVDMKASWDPAHAWHSHEVEDLDIWIGKFLGSRVYSYRNLVEGHLGNPKDPRAELQRKGWPTARSLAGKIIVALTGGTLGSVNQHMRKAYVRFNGRNQKPTTFFCPDVDANDPGEISAKVDGMGRWDSEKVLCKNLKAGDHHQVVMNYAARYKQILHLWGAGGDFSSTDYAHSFIAVAHGASVIGWDVPQSRNSSSVHKPAWTANIPLVGVRRSLPGYFRIRTAHGNGQKCLHVRGGKYRNGGGVWASDCSGKADFNQEFVYTAEGQLRARGNNKYCVDYEGGKAKNNKNVHLWDCDGGDSEKWAITPDGRFRSRENSWTHCMDLDTRTSNMVIWGCDRRPNWSEQTFFLEEVSDWLQEDF